MAIAFARVSVHTRSKGHSSINGAAYRAGVRMLDERTGEIHNYENRDDVKYESVILPDGADEKFLSREFLWNEAERYEIRKDAQVAKDIVLALPKELSLDKQIELTRNFAYTHFVSDGIPADITIHDNGDNNPHAHIYITTRRLERNKFGKKARDQNPEFAKKRGEGIIGNGFIKTSDYWGEKWRELQNNYFREHGIDLIVDQNRVVSQGHQGRIGKETHYLKEQNRLKHELSVEIALNDPDSLLNVLSAQAVFSEKDIASLIFKNTDTEEQYKEAYTKLKAHRDLIYLGLAEDGRERYTSRANYLREAELSDHVSQLTLNKGHIVADRTVKKAIRKNGLNEEQAEALRHIAGAGDICAVVGRAGTGKSYMMKAANSMWVKAGYNVRGMAISGIAAKSLENESGIESSTIHSIKAKIAYNSLKLTSQDILVIDEAGMADLNDVAVIVDEVRKAGAKLVLIGDHAQLQPIGKGAPFRAIIERCGFAEINLVIRQQDAKDRVATMALSKGKISEAVDYYNSKGRVHIFDKSQHAIDGLIDNWQKGITKDNLTNNIITAFRNVDVDELNSQARKRLVAKGVISATGSTVITEKGEIELSIGDRILFLRNNKQLGISNGQFATIVKVIGSEISVLLDNNTQMTFSTEAYRDFSYGYAATVHKLQGATFNNVYVYMGSRAWNRHLTYVALSRHKESVNLYIDRSTHKDLGTLKKNLSRDGFKDAVLDWPLSFAIRRGFDPEGIMGRFIDKMAGIQQIIKDKWLFVVNYEAYLQNKIYQERQRINQKRRNEAQLVAGFIDLNREINSKWFETRKLSKGQEVEGHVDDQLKHLMIERNHLAYKISIDASKYKHALSLNGYDIKYLQSYVEAHQNRERVKAFMKAQEEGQNLLAYKIAHDISKDNKAHAFFVQELSNWKDINYAKKHYKEHLQCLDQDEFKKAKIIEHYRSLLQDVAKAWHRANAEHRNKARNPNEAKSRVYAKALTDRCDKLAYEINQSRTSYIKYLGQYKIDIGKLEKAANRNRSRSQSRSQSRDREYNVDWDKLKDIKAKDIEFLFKVKDHMDNAKSEYFRNLYKQDFENAILRISRDTKLMQKIQELQPKSAARIKALSIEFARTRSIGRDR
jgi:Ti-type conjugative transfer relaxase TraA